jgi:geranyl-CoA carboxylase alpha subunit
VLHWRAPPGVRCDHALASGCAISPFYDSMLGKLIAHAPTRVEAMRQLADALDRTLCLGLPTNRGFLAQVLRHPAFASDAVTTAFLATHFADNAARASPVPSWLEALAAAAHVALPRDALPPLWRGWTSSRRLDADAPIALDAQVKPWRVQGTHHDLNTVCAGVSHRITALTHESDAQLRAVVDGRPVTATRVCEGNRSWWLCEGIELDAQDLRLTGAAGDAAAATGALHAPMHGRVTQVLVECGASVEAGMLLVVMEAMKMEHQIHAPHDGTVKALLARVGEQVSARQLLVEISA